MIRLDQVTIHQGGFVLAGVSFRVRTGDYAVLMGKTGSGKTTILEVICGLRRADSGRVILAGREVTGLRPGERGVGYVPQEGALFPTMSVRKNLAFALSIRGVPKQEQDRRVSELAQLLEIGHLLDRMPDRLSGGERQRVALGRALAHKPAILCLDEPLSALDADTRGSMEELLISVARHEDVTALHVTHNTAEAARLGDTQLRIEDGRVVELKPQMNDGALG